MKVLLVKNGSDLNAVELDRVCGGLISQGKKNITLVGSSIWVRPKCLEFEHVFVDFTSPRILPPIKISEIWFWGAWSAPEKSAFASHYKCPTKDYQLIRDHFMDAYV